MSQQEEHQCAFCDATEYFKELRKTRLSEEECFENALELFFESMIEEVGNEFYEEGWQRGYAKAYQSVVEDLANVSDNINQMVYANDIDGTCDDCDCDGECYR